MPQPTPSQLHIDTYLTNVSVSYAQDQANFIATRVFPRVPVNKQSDKFAIYPKGYFYRDEMEVRPLGGRPKEVGYEVTQGNYYCEEYGLEHKIDDRTRENADQPLDPDKSAMRLLTGQGLIKQDRMWATAFFQTGVWSIDWAGVDSAPSTNQFLAFDQSGADPIEFFDQRIEAIGGATGFMPNKLVLGPAAYRAIKNNPAVLDRIKYTQRGIVTTDLLASLLELDEVLVARGVYNTANEGQADNIQYIVNTDSALLVHAAAAPSLDTPTGGYTFTWTGLLGANSNGAVIERGREELAHSDVFQARLTFDAQLVASELGEFYTACSSS